MGKYCPYIDAKVTYQHCNECDKHICTDDAFFCLVVGSRSFQSYSNLKSKLDFLLQNQSNIVIISGGAKGADSLAEQYAKEKGYPFLVFPANWKKFGRKAGYIRNQEMHQFLSRQKKRGVVAFWDGKSRGAQHNFTLATQYNNPLKVITFETSHNK